jgi:hypothetical protein
MYLMTEAKHLKKLWVASLLAGLTRGTNSVWFCLDEIVKMLRRRPAGNAPALPADKTNEKRASWIHSCTRRFASSSSALSALHSKFGQRLVTAKAQDCCKTFVQRARYDVGTDVPERGIVVAGQV